MNTDLVPIGERLLPTRLHKDEKVHLSHAELQNDDELPALLFLLDVHYTFGGSADGAGGVRQVKISQED